MKKIYPLMIFLCFVFGHLHAQHSFVVQNGTAAVFNSLIEAYDASSDGDTIYLPGGEFAAPQNITKSLAWIGVGHHPDSTSATYFTAITNYLYLKGTCDNSYFTGIFFRGNLNFNDAEDNATDVTFERCRIDGGITLKGNNDTLNINFRLSECYISGMNASYGSNVIVEKCIINGTVNNFYQSEFNRDIFVLGRSISYGPKYVFFGTSNSLILNSIFIQYHTSLYECQNNTFMNNLFAESIVLPQGTNMGINNLIGKGINQFKDVAAPNTFAYENDYHLKPDSPAKGMANDGSDIGLYGATDSIKAGFIPAYPHIKYVNINLETSNGMLPVEIKVSAQDN